MMHWLHHWLNPHCPDCKEEKREALVCISCENFKSQLETLRYDNQKLLDALIRRETAAPETQPFDDTLKPIMPRMVPWSVKRQMLEAEDRHTAILRKKQQEAAKTITTEELEKELELGLADAESARSQEKGQG